MTKSLSKMKFEDAMSRLDAIVEAIESGEIGIEESITRHEEAMKLAAHCRGILDAAEQRISKIQIDSSGALRSEPFDVPAAESENADNDASKPPL